MNHMAETISLGACASTRKACVDATAPTTSSCGHSSYQQGLSEPARPEGSSSLCWSVPTLVNSASPTVSELDCAVGASGAATRAYDDNSILPGWPLTSPRFGFAVAGPTNATGGPGEHDGRASSNGVQNGNAQLPPMGFIPELTAAMPCPERRTAQPLVQQPHLGSGLSIGILRHSPAARNVLALGSNHLASDLPPTHALGRELAGGLLDLETPTVQRCHAPARGHESRALAPSARCGDAASQQRGARAAPGAAGVSQEVGHGRKRSWQEASGADAGALGSETRHGSRPSSGPNPRRIEMASLDAPGLQHLAAAADAVLRMPQLTLQATPADAPACSHDLVGLSPCRDPSDFLVYAEAASARLTSTPRGLCRGYDPTPDAQHLPRGTRPRDGGSCRLRRETGLQLNDDVGQGQRPVRWPQLEQTEAGEQAKAGKECEVAETGEAAEAGPELLRGNCRSLGLTTSEALRQELRAAGDEHVQGASWSSLCGGRAERPVSARKGGYLHAGSRAPMLPPRRVVIAPSAPVSAGDCEPALAALRRAAAGAALGADLSDTARRPAGREALHEALILLTAQYYMERGLSIKE